MAKKQEKKSPATFAEKQQAIKLALERVNKDGGMAGFINDSRISEALTLKVIPSPNDNLNKALGAGGFPVGRMTVIAGLPDSGKTSLALETIGLQMQKNPEFLALWLESENSLEMDYIVKTFNIDPTRFVVVSTSATEGGEKALDQCAALLRTEAFDMFVVNSLKGLIPRQQLDKSITEETVALQARLNTKALSQFISIIKDFNITMIAIQHLSTLIGNTMSRDPYAVAGGLFLKHSAAIILDMRKQSVLDVDPISREEGCKYMINIKKNHVCQFINPYVKVPHYIIYGEGTEKVLTTLKSAIEQGILKATGAWIFWENRNLKWNGKQAFRADMREHPEILQTLRNLINGDIKALTDEEKVELGISEEENNAEEILETDPDMLEEE